MTENIIIGLAFVAALAYLFNLVRTQFNTKQDGCAKGCGCDTSAKPSAIKQRQPSA